MTVFLVSLCVLIAFLAVVWVRSLRERARMEVEYARSLARAEAERDAAVDSLNLFHSEEARRSDVLRLEMESLSHQIMEARTARLIEMEKDTLSNVVGPVRQELERLKKSLEESEKNDAVREANFASALRQVLELNTRLGDQAEGLAKALKGDNKIVGDYGEVLLERLLEYSGLRKGEHFIEQGEGLGLKNAQGGHLKPDVLILLPEKRCLVVDSKMSLLSWVNAQNLNEAEQASALKAFRQSLRAHVDNLSSKSYTESMSSLGLESIDFKFLFIPIEAAFHACLNQDPDLYKYAFDKRIVLTSPTTLLATLTTVHHTWRQYDIGRNAQEISNRAGLLLDKFNDFLSSMEEMGRHLHKAQTAFDEANARLSSGRGNLVGQAEKLRNLGVQSRKAMPRTYAALSDGE